MIFAPAQTVLVTIFVRKSFHIGYIFKKEYAAMPLTDLQKKNINKTAQKILHIPGNTPKGNVLELALVLDCSLDPEYIRQTSKDVLSFLRKEGDPFLNMRLNLIKWKSDEDFIKYVSSYPDVLMGRQIDEADISVSEKHLDTLAGQLKKFYARSKIVILISDKKNCTCLNPEQVQEDMKPFLHKKMIFIYEDDTFAYLPQLTPAETEDAAADETASSADQPTA